MSSAHSKKYEFKAEVKKLLDILVHSLYTSREIFLRELISNASDALDKLRFESNKGTDIQDKDLALEIKIELDEKNNIIRIIDTGVGMTHDDLIANIGTIAKSGTEEFVKMIADAKADANNLIGKFGVGFYSVFMAAQKVIIKTKSFKKEEPAVEWTSDGLGDYEISTPDENIKRGTQIEIHLKEDAKEFSQKYKVESAIKKHSNFISYPIFVESEKINTVAAIWREPKSNISKEQYEEFYKFLSYDSEAPMETIHKTVDAPIQFNVLVFIPKKSNEFFWMDRDNYGLDLYVRRVLIQHKNKDLLPEYLSFVKGVVDSEDLPLNISRETLQENVVFSKIASSVTATILNYLLDKAKNDAEAYNEFWKQHGRIFKLGYSDFVNHDKILDLLRFNSSSCKDKNELVSLGDYAARFKEKQKEIFYITGQSREAFELDPHIEIFKRKGIEVLYLTDPVDEFVINSLRKYKEFEFKSVDTADLKTLNDIQDVEEKKNDLGELSGDEKKHFFSLLSKMKSILGDKVEDVVESKRLVGSPVCLVSKDEGLSASMLKMMKLANQGFGGEQKKLMEVNPDHKLVRNMVKVFQKDSNDEYIESITAQLFDSALLQEGSLEDPHQLIKRMNELLEKSSDWYVSVKNIS